jgi:hypothetical protein
VRIDEPREHVLAGGIDHLGAGGRGNAAVDPRDRFPFAEDVGGVSRVGVDDVGVFDQERHGITGLPRSCLRRS